MPINAEVYPVPVRKRAIGDNPDRKMGGWQQWLEQPQKAWLHNAVFQIHYLVGAVAGAYVGLMSRGIHRKLCRLPKRVARVSFPPPVWKTPHDSSGRRDRPPREWRRRGLSDVAVFDGSHRLVAWKEALAAEPNRKLGSALRAYQLGFAQCAGVLVLLVCSGMGCVWRLLRLSALV